MSLSLDTKVDPVLTPLCISIHLLTDAIFGLRPKTVDVSINIQNHLSTIFHLPSIIFNYNEFLPLVNCIYVFNLTGFLTFVFFCGIIIGINNVE